MHGSRFTAASRPPLWGERWLKWRRSAGRVRHVRRRADEPQGTRAHGSAQREDHAPPRLSPPDTRERTRTTTVTSTAQSVGARGRSTGPNKRALPHSFTCTSLKSRHSEAMPVLHRAALPARQCRSNSSGSRRPCPASAGTGDRLQHTRAHQIPLPIRRLHEQPRTSLHQHLNLLMTDAGTAAAEARPGADRSGCHQLTGCSSLLSSVRPFSEDQGIGCRAGQSTATLQALGWIIRFA